MYNTKVELCIQSNYTEDHVNEYRKKRKNKGKKRKRKAPKGKEHSHTYPVTALEEGGSAGVRPLFLPKKNSYVKLFQFENFT